MHPAELSDAIKRSARSLGFDACGVARAAPIDPEDRLGQWLGAGRHATMEWMARTAAVRQDVSKKLEGAQSVIVVARNYFAQRPSAAAGTGRVSRYAWGRDYHRVLEKPLRKLAGFLQELDPGCTVYTCIDSGPVMEKAWAERAGVGWIGKNSLALSRDLGSYFFLGAIIATARLAPDAPIPDQCGGCTLCVDACPTQAIVQPKVVDARRCISYHTIENRGDVPPDLAPRFGDWAFGCDVCQDVCPWNRKFAHDVTDPDLEPDPRMAAPDLAELLALTEETFRARFRGTPVLRTKRRGLARNVAVALGNRGTGDDEAALSRAANDPDPLVQAHVAWALGHTSARDDR